MKGERFRLIADLVAGQSVLDIGCIGHSAQKIRSEEWLHRHICRHANQVVGLDFAEAQVKILQAEGYDIVVGDAEDFDVGQRFDRIVAAELIEHLLNPGKFLHCAKNHLKSDGILILTTPNPFYPKRILEILIQGKVNVHPEHTMWYCPQTLEVMLKLADYREVNVTTFNNNDFLFGIGKLPSRFRPWLSTQILATARP